MKTSQFAKTIPWLLGAISLLTACGGGGGASQANLADAQGRWHGNLVLTAGTQNASALVLPDGGIWMLYAVSGGGRRLVQGALSVDGQRLAGSAKLFDLDTANALSDVSLTAQAHAGSSLTVNSNDAVQVGSFSSTSFVSQNTPAISLAGVWSDVLNTPTVQWTIGNDGVLTGYGTGCTISGHVAARVDSAAVADVQLTETCSGTSSTWSGVGLNGSTANSLRLTLVKSDRSQAFVLELLK